MRMPAYGGSLLDPGRFPWLYADRSAWSATCKVSDRVMLHVLSRCRSRRREGEARRISFRDIDVEQIGYIYEGLLGYTCADRRPTMSSSAWSARTAKSPRSRSPPCNELYDEHQRYARRSSTELIDWVKKDQPAASLKTAAQLAKLDDAEGRRGGPAASPHSCRRARSRAARDPDRLGQLHPP